MLPLGDYVTRCMLARVDYWTAIWKKTGTTPFAVGQDKRLAVRT